MKPYFWKRVLIISCLSGILGATTAQTVYKIPEKAERILFLGNSITYGAHYVNYVIAYLHLNYPDRDFEFINVGLPSETVSGLSEAGHADGKFPRPDLHERLDRILVEVKPDFVFSCYGMNDGIYLPFEDGRFLSYRKGQEMLHKKVTATGAGLVHLTPPIYDENKGAAYANVLDIYSSWLLSQRYTQDWQVIDLHWPMRKFLEEKREESQDYFLAADGIHPNETGHWLMARELLLGIGEHHVYGVNSHNDYFSKQTNGTEILDLVEEYQAVTKDAWLTHIGHKRPGMKSGIPLEKANEASTQVLKKLKSLKQ
ncbi:SGNH/GDSL hydrolase family protein [Lunatibacter salilacus]|uniref:SGNH/GDSL hydrolase family protein n=1 Tax=Lunatibacter salilacus TaxID=2483804 RepID=UPI00131C6B12|nr:SGNH/GDSL hydrolase family protein [Lunatibacter salilacus]